MCQAEILVRQAIGSTNDGVKPPFQILSKRNGVPAVEHDLLSGLIAESLPVYHEHALLQPEEAGNESVRRYAILPQEMEALMEILNRGRQIEALLWHLLQVVLRAVLLQLTKQITGSTAIGGNEGLQSTSNISCLCTLLSLQSSSFIALLPCRDGDSHGDACQAANRLNPCGPLDARCMQPVWVSRKRPGQDQAGDEGHRADNQRIPSDWIAFHGSKLHCDAGILLHWEDRGIG